MSDRAEPGDKHHHLDEPADESRKPLVPDSSYLVRDSVMSPFMPQASGEQWLDPIRNPEEAATFTATAANLRNVLNFFRGPRLQPSIRRPGSTLDDMFAKHHEILKEKSEKAQIVLKRLADLQDSSVIRHIVISAFAFYEPFRAGQELRSLLLEPGGRPDPRDTITKILLPRWGVRFDGNTNEAAYFRIAVEGFLLCAVTYPTHGNIDKPGLAIDLLRYVKNIYQSGSRERLNQFRAIINSYANRPDLSQYQVGRVCRILDGPLDRIQLMPHVQARELNELFGKVGEAFGKAGYSTSDAVKLFDGSLTAQCTACGVKISGSAISLAQAAGALLGGGVALLGSTGPAMHRLKDNKCITTDCTSNTYNLMWSDEKTRPIFDSALLPADAVRDDNQ